MATETTSWRQLIADGGATAPDFCPSPYVTGSKTELCPRSCMRILNQWYTAKLQQEYAADKRAAKAAEAGDRDAEVLALTEKSNATIWATKYSRAATAADRERYATR